MKKTQQRSPSRDLRNCVAVVTGSSSGIGQAIAIELARRGADVLVHARSNLAGAQQTARMIATFRQQSRVILSDIADPSSAYRLTAAAWQWKNRVDIWVNNAGADILTTDMRDKSYEEKLDALYQVDIRGTALISRAAGAKMLNQPPGNCLPTIINLGWDQADSGMEGDAGQLFAPIKSAVAALTKSLAATYAPHIRVNAVAPGWIQTAWGDNAPEYWDRRAKGESLLGRWGTGQDIAAAVGFLASPAAEFINGQILPVNGGWRKAFHLPRDNNAADA